MHNSSRGLAPHTSRSLAAGSLVLALGLAACGGSGMSTAAAGVAVTPGPANLGSAAAATASAAVPASASPISAAPTPAASLEALKLLWQKGGPTQVKPSTYWPAIDPITGNVWVASSFDNAYWIFSPAGKYLESWGKAGRGPGQFALQTNDASPDGQGAIAFAPDGSFYVVDTGNYRIEKFDKSRKFVTQWGSFGTGDGQFANPKGIATDGKTVYVADDPRGDVQAFDTNGAFLRSIPVPFVLFTLGANGNLYSADPTGILELDPNGKQVAHIDLDWTALEGGPGQVVVDKAGHVFLPINDRPDPTATFELIEFDPHGAVLGRWAAGGETSAIAPDGSSIYFAYTGPQGNWSFIRKYALPKP
jgi:DNA-binding beta-propeller fold protein YncE